MGLTAIEKNFGEHKLPDLLYMTLYSFFCLDVNYIEY